MYKIDVATAAVSLPTPAALGTEGFWTSGVPGVTPATVLDQDWFNALQGSLVGVVDFAGLAHSKSDYTVLRRSIQAISATVAGAARNLAGSAAGGTVTASWTVDELVAETGLGGSVFKGASLSLAFNGAGTGAGGMDNTAVPASGDLNIYAIYNPTTNTWSTLGTVTGHGAIYPGGHMPAGYTASALICAVKTDSSSKIVAFSQSDRAISIAPANAITGASATTPTSVSIASIVPAAARAVSGFLTSSSALQIAVGSDANLLGEQETGSTAAGQASGAFNALILKTAQTLFYEVTGGTNGIVTISGYTI